MNFISGIWFHDVHFSFLALPRFWPGLRALSRVAAEQIVGVGEGMRQGVSMRGRISGWASASAP